MTERSLGDRIGDLSIMWLIVAIVVVGAIVHMVRGGYLGKVLAGLAIVAALIGLAWVVLSGLHWMWEHPLW